MDKFQGGGNFLQRLVNQRGSGPEEGLVGVKEERPRRAMESELHGDRHLVHELEKLHSHRSDDQHRGWSSVYKALST